MAVHHGFTCAKCAHDTCETAEIRTTGKFSRFFDVQNKKFVTISCTSCGYTEMYRANSSALGNILDLFTS